MPAGPADRQRSVRRRGDDGGGGHAAELEAMIRAMLMISSTHGAWRKTLAA
jgi:hypothetical protein